MTILVPDTIYAGDTVIFDVPEFTDPVGNSIASGTYTLTWYCLLYTSPSPRDRTRSRMPSSA